MYPFRAIEHRVSIVRSANTGISAFIAPSGRIVRRMGLFERGIMTDRVSVRSVDTLYTRLGDWVAYVGFVVSGFVLITAGARGRQ
jgi:apolipoprotein N-acyltransferase